MKAQGAVPENALDRGGSCADLVGEYPTVIQSVRRGIGRSTRICVVKG